MYINITNDQRLYVLSPSLHHELLVCTFDLEHALWSRLTQQGPERIGTTYTSHAEACWLSPQQ